MVRLYTGLRLQWQGKHYLVGQARPDGTRNLQIIAWHGEDHSHEPERTAALRRDEPYFRTLAGALITW